MIPAQERQLAHIACMPVRRGEDYQVTPYSTVEECFTCNCEIHVSPTTTAVMGELMARQVEPRTHCLLCAVEKRKEDAT